MVSRVGRRFAQQANAANDLWAVALGDPVQDQPDALLGLTGVERHPNLPLRRHPDLRTLSRHKRGIVVP
jgi:hypothetical protein